MKKLITIALAAALSATMIACMTACNNGGGEQNSNVSGTPTSNPFNWGPTSAAQSETTDSQLSSNTTPSETPTPSVPDFSSTVSIEIVSQTSTVSIPPVEPTESGTSDLPLPSATGNPDDSDWDDSYIDDSDWEDSDEYSTVTPKGTVMPEYVGTWVWQFDFSGLDPEEAALAEQFYDSANIDLRFILDSSGSVNMSIVQNGQTSSDSDGQWCAEGNTLYITYDGYTVEFSVNNGRMTSNEFEFGFFQKA